MIAMNERLTNERTNMLQHNFIGLKDNWSHVVAISTMCYYYKKAVDLLNGSVLLSPFGVSRPVSGSALAQLLAVLSDIYKHKNSVIVARCFTYLYVYMSRPNMI